MRTVILPLLALLVSIAGTPAFAEEEKKELPIPEGPPKQHTTVRGTPPADLAGRWLVAGWIDLPRGQGSRTTQAFWEVTGSGDQMVLTVRFVPLPEAQQKALDAANTANQRWQPTADDLAALAAAWNQPETDPHLATIENEIVARDGFDDDFKREPRTRDAIWAVRQREDFHPSAAPAVRQINVYGALAAKDGGYAGNFTTATLAAAPFPIPITLNGSFQTYRVEVSSAPPPPRGFLARLLDFFRGCGRR